MTRLWISSLSAFTLLAGAPANALQPAIPSAAAIGAHVAAAMKATGARSLAVAVVDDGRVVFVRAYGVRNAVGAPLQANSIMYGASLTKAVFAYLVLQLVDAGKIDLDTPIDRYLPAGLAAYEDADTIRRYGDFRQVAEDPRSHRLTARMLLNHASGLANISAAEPEGRLQLHFEPGSRYAYSGMGLLLLQLVLERGLGLDVAQELQTRVFNPLGMTDTALVWRPDFEGRAASGWTLAGEAPGHAQQSKVRVAGSMDTTIEDMARFAAALVRGDRLSARSRRELTRPQLAITTVTQFPTLQPEAAISARFKDLAVGTVLITFKGPKGAGFMKGGHNDLTGNTMMCLQLLRRCVVMLGADVRAEPAFPELTRFILGETGFPWSWEYQGMVFWRPK